MYYYGFNERKKERGMKYLGTDESVLMDFNNQGYAIFWCRNMNANQEYEGKREKARIQDTDINVFFIDMDDGTKDEMWIKLIESPLVPSMVVETGRGYHVYWNTDQVTLETFEDVQKRLIDYYGSDGKCKDVVRLLRVPGFKQYKRDVENVIELVWDDDNLFYSDREMMEAYPMSRDYARTSVKPEVTFKKYSRSGTDSMLSWDLLTQMDQGELLMRLSGSDSVRGEIYELKDNSNGTKQILVDGKSTGCFINENQDIIADHGFSGNIFNWLRWTSYGHSDKDIYEIVRHVVPEVFRR